MPTREKRLRLEANKRRREAATSQSAPAATVAADPAAPGPLPEETSMSSPPEIPMWWTRFTLPDVKYFTYRGANYDRGQLLSLVGGPRDEQLERLGFVQRESKEEVHLNAQCGVCGCWFLTEQFRSLHGELRHADRFATDLNIGGGMDGPDGGAALRDVTGDAEERRMQQQYPLYLEKTRATLDSSPA